MALTAKEKFEEAGWEYYECDEFIQYRHENQDMLIVFELYEKTYSYSAPKYEVNLMDMETLKLVICQCEELRWL